MAAAVEWELVEETGRRWGAARWPEPGDMMLTLPGEGVTVGDNGGRDCMGMELDCADGGRGRGEDEMGCDYVLLACDGSAHLPWPVRLLFGKSQAGNSS